MLGALFGLCSFFVDLPLKLMSGYILFLTAAGAGVPMVCLVRFKLRSIYIVSMSECWRNDIAADRALNRFGFSSRFTVRRMRSFAAFDYNAAACYGAYMPVVIRIRLPLCALGMTERRAVLKGYRTLFAAGAGLIVSCLCRTGSVSRLISIGCYFLVEYMGMTELCFDYITTFRTLNGIFLGSVTFMIRCMRCKIAFFGAACCLASMPVTACVICPAGSRIVRRFFTVLYITNITDSFMLAGSNICAS